MGSFAWRHWAEAARPKTLPAAVIPVLVGTALAAAHRTADYGKAAICLLFALLVQIGTNFANDYFDFVQGADTPARVGPRRAVAAGLIAPRTMLTATWLVLGMAFLVGVAELDLRQVLLEQAARGGALLVQSRDAAVALPVVVVRVEHDLSGLVGGEQAPGERVHDAGPTGPQRLHLGAGQHDAGLERVDDLIVAARLAVLRHELSGEFALGLAFGVLTASR